MAARRVLLALPTRAVPSATRLTSSLVRPSIVASPAVGLAPGLALRTYATRQVQHKKGSETAQELLQNAKEEVQSAAHSVVDVISGGAHTGNAGSAPAGIEKPGESTADEIKQTIGSVTSLAEHVPRQAWVFGSAGLIPYGITAATTIYLARQAALSVASGSASVDAETAMALLHHVQNIQVTYGAIILSFLGALHWGMEFAKFGGAQGSMRYALGTVPVILAWPTLLLPNQVALASQFVAFAVTWFLDMRATNMGWTPQWYSTYRWALTTGVGLLILLTLIGGSLLGPGSGAPTSQERLDDLHRRQKQQLQASGGSGGFQGETTGGVTVQSGEEAYGIVRNIEQEKEEARKKREEERKKQEAEERKARGEKDMEAAEAGTAPKTRKAGA